MRERPGRSSGRRSSCACAAASRPRASACTPARRARCTPCATTADNRLGLARWLVDPNNPLVARVVVNRLWEQLFGRGLGRDQRGLRHRRARRRRIPSCSTGWRPSSSRRLEPEGAAPDDRHVGDLPAVVGVTPALAERDPYNRLLARGPRFRLEAEMIRDVALAVSGLLSAKMFGPSVFPLQPDGIWNMPYNCGQMDDQQGRGSLSAAACTRSGGARRRIRAS